MNPNIQFTPLALAINAALTDAVPESAPQWVQVIPAGEMEGRDGRKFINDDPDAIVAHFNNSKKDLLVDLDHGSYQKNPIDPLVRRAFGWIKELQNRVKDGIWARVEWTPEGMNLISSKAYRYLSPALNIDPKTGRIKALDSVGLVNNPNLHLPALNHEDTLMSTEQEIALQQQINAARAELNQSNLQVQQLTTENAQLKTELNAQLELVKSQQTAIFEAQLNTLIAQYSDRVYPAIEKEIKEGAIDWLAVKGAEITLNRVENELKRLPVIGGAAVNLAPLPGQVVETNQQTAWVAGVLGLKPEEIVETRREMYGS